MVVDAVGADNLAAGRKQATGDVEADKTGRARRELRNIACRSGLRASSIGVSTVTMNEEGRPAENPRVGRKRQRGVLEIDRFKLRACDPARSQARRHARGRYRNR